MHKSFPGTGRFDVTAHLFRLVEALPKDKKLILLKQLLGNRVSTYLCKLILDLPEDRRLSLLDQLAGPPFEDAPVTTIDLDAGDSQMRQKARTACHLRAVCLVDGRTFDTVITDLSTVGMFIQTPSAYPPGKPIRVGCRLPDRPKALVLNGEVLRSEAGGVGVRIDGLTAEHEKAIRSFIDSR
jgi:hypothetical protein